MFGVMLQDWLSVQGNNSTTNSFLQSEADWFDASAYQDIIFWLHCSQYLPNGAGALQVALQTSPIKNEGSFATMTTFTLAAGVQVTPIILATANVPLARWVRWQFTVTAPAAAIFAATFRILAAANPRGA
jgi:hypothetical protein